jgi:sugar phosphate permease
LAKIDAQLQSDESAAAALTTVVSGKADKATTLAGYGIADAYTKSATDTALGLKANTSSLATVATSGSYTDLTNKPTLFSGSYTDLTSKPTLFSGSYTDLTNKPTLFSGAFSDLTGKPTTLTGYGITDAYTKSAVDTALGLKANTSSLATVATSGLFADLASKPTTLAGYGIVLTNSNVTTALGYTPFNAANTLSGGTF